ncbi:unnamed protein product [Laminaria digitata]
MRQNTETVPSSSSPFRTDRLGSLEQLQWGYVNREVKPIDQKNSRGLDPLCRCESTQISNSLADIQIQFTVKTHSTQPLIPSTARDSLHQSPPPPNCPSRKGCVVNGQTTKASNK